MAPPDAHSWKEEAELVASGLAEVVAFWNEDERDAARVMAERVYTDRWEPHLEPALRLVEGPLAAAEVEYTFGLLLVDLEKEAGRGKVEERVRVLESRVRAVADEAARVYPSPADLAAPPPAKPDEGSRPVVPDLKPRWEQE